MRISEDRYTRDVRRLDLAQRLIRHEVRTRWICAWTGLSDDRVRNLFRSYHKASGEVTRHRGPSPTRLQAFLRSPTLRAEASAIGGLAYVLGVVPAPVARSARREPPALEAGERLCAAFELYRQIVRQSSFTMDQFFALVEALSDAEELHIAHCRSCHGALLTDRAATRRMLCLACQEDSLGRSAEPQGEAQSTPGLSESAEPPEGYQQSLF